MNNEKYNGWSNYATWRVNLELIDGINFVKEDITSSDQKLSIEDIADFLENNVVENALTNNGEITRSVALDFTRAFIDGQVNYIEIAEHVVENYPALLE